MKYLLFLTGSEAEWEEFPAEEKRRRMDAFAALEREPNGVRVLEGAELGHAATATTVRVRDGKSLVTDGPWAETKEQLDGYYLVERRLQGVS